MMRRTPLRPLARILQARSTGENPDVIEAENLRVRHEDLRDTLRARAETRLFVVGMLFFAGFLVVGLRMGIVASTEVEEPRIVDNSGASIVAARSDIVDRNGRILATNLITNALYAQPHMMVDPVAAARGLAAIFPDLDAADLEKRFGPSAKFLWIKRNISPEQQQAVHDLGEPGLLFGPREMRLYPNGRLAAHVLGGAGYGREGVRSAEVVGRAGVEKVFDEYLRDPAKQGAPLQLSLDLTVQTAVERLLYGGMRLMNAKGAAAVLMDAHTGEVISLASLPDFDPNARPLPLTQGDQSDDPTFNRAVQGVYELGSTFKIFAVAQAMELGLVNPATMIDTRTPLPEGGRRIRDFKDYGPQLSVTDIIVKSSNIGTARIALQIGGDRQQEFLRSLGLFEATALELTEAPSGRPLLPDQWRPVSTMTISYGHGLSASPLHLATAYASVLNGGTRITPTLLRRDTPQDGPRIVSPTVSATSREMLRQVVSSDRGTASMARVPLYQIGGKTGTADKPDPRGGYYDDKVITTFASVFPTDDPKYILVVTLDEPEDRTGPEPRRTAGWTAVPVAAAIISRVAPLLGLRPDVDHAPVYAIPVAAN
jgi:cell division protein FtsI (penicillin-binding protein 3)